MVQLEKEAFENKVIKVLDTVKPYLQADGGDISFVDVSEDFVVRVQLLGACSSCSMSVHTLKLGVEQALKSALPQIKEVVAVDYDLEY